MLLVIGDEARFEVSLERAFGPDASAREVGRSDEGFLSVDDDGLGVDAGAEDALEEIGLDEGGEAVEIFAESWSWFLGVEETDGDSVIHEVGEDFEKGDEASAFLDMEVLDVSGDDPEKTLGVWDHLDDDALVDFFVEDKFGHRVLEEDGGIFESDKILLLGNSLAREEYVGPLSRSLRIATRTLVRRRFCSLATFPISPLF